VISRIREKEFQSDSAKISANLCATLRERKTQDAGKAETREAEEVGKVFPLICENFIILQAEGLSSKF